MNERKLRLNTESLNAIDPDSTYAKLVSGIEINIAYPRSLLADIMAKVIKPICDEIDLLKKTIKNPLSDDQSEVGEN